METDFVASFLLVVDTGSMAEAARRLDLTPAAVAQQIRSLERELGTALLARAGRTVMPTPAGSRIIVHSRGLMRDFADLNILVNEEHATGELRIGTINTALHGLLPDVLSGFSKAHPRVKIFIHLGTSAELYDALRRGDIDAAVCTRAAFAMPKDFAWELLREEPLVLLVHQRMVRHDPHDVLRNEPLIRYDRTLAGGKEAERYLRRAGIVPNERLELSSLAAISMMVDRGLGVSLVPDIASPLTKGLRINALRLPDESQPRQFGVLWPRASVREPLIGRLVFAARTYMDSMEA